MQEGARPRPAGAAQTLCGGGGATRPGRLVRRRARRPHRLNQHHRAPSDQHLPGTARSSRQPARGADVWTADRPKLPRGRHAECHALRHRCCHPGEPRSRSGATRHERAVISSRGITGCLRPSLIQRLAGRLQIRLARTADRSGSRLPRSKPGAQGRRGGPGRHPRRSGANPPAHAIARRFSAPLT
jgi:hypothetical protein